MSFIKIIIIVILSQYIFGCVEKTTYSGKIISEKNLSSIKISDKNQLLEKFGPPSYVDTIQNKYFYYTEKTKKKNFYNENTYYSYLFVFELNDKDIIIDTETINLLNLDDLKYKKNKTLNNIVERGLIEKIFGGVGPNQLPNSP